MNLAAGGLIVLVTTGLFILCATPRCGCQSRHRVQFPVR
jgi:hypothetical protein